MSITNDSLPRSPQVQVIPNTQQELKVYEEKKLDEFIAGYVKSEVCPIRFKDKPLDCKIAYLAAQKMGINPLLGLLRIYVLHGTPCLYAEALIAVIQSSEDFAGMDIEKNDIEGAIVTLERYYPKFDRFKKITISFSKEDAIRAELIKDKSVENDDVIIKALNGDDEKKFKDVWKLYPQDMLFYKAFSRAAKRLFADKLMGVEIMELYQAESPKNKQREQQKKIDNFYEEAAVEYESKS